MVESITKTRKKNKTKKQDKKKQLPQWVFDVQRQLALEKHQLNVEKCREYKWTGILTIFVHSRPEFVYNKPFPGIPSSLCTLMIL